MLNEMRPRSLLIVPAVKVERYARSLCSYDIDGVIFDLEDSVAPEYKSKARNLLEQYLVGNRPTHLDIYIRPNSVGTPYHESDMEMLGRVEPDVLAVSKLEQVSEVQQLLTWLDDYETRTGKQISLFPAIETLVGYQNRDEILSACKERAFLFTLGYEDLSAELGIDRPNLSKPNPLTSILMELVISAKSHGIPMIDSVCRKFQQNDLAGLLEEVEFGKSIGLYGKLAIHPNQIDIINTAYNKADLLEQQRRVVTAFSRLDDGSSVIVNEQGEIEDTPSLKRANGNLLLFKQ